MRYDYLYMDPWSVDRKEGNSHRKPLYICLSGNSGVGKSTFLRRLASALFKIDPCTIAIDEKSVHHPLLSFLFDETDKYGFLIQLNFMVQRALMVKSWLDKGFNLVMERSHSEDYIFINFMLKAGYISQAQHQAYIALWENINAQLPEPDIIVFLNYTAEHSMAHLHNDETQGIRPQEFPDEQTKKRWIDGWHREYQSFEDSLSEPLRQRVITCYHPEEIDTFFEKVFQQVLTLRRKECVSESLSVL